MVFKLKHNYIILSMSLFIKFLYKLPDKQNTLILQFKKNPLPSIQVKEVHKSISVLNKLQCGYDKFAFLPEKPIYRRLDLYLTKP